MAAGLPFEVEPDHPLAEVLDRVERWRLTGLALAEARLPEASTTGALNPMFGVAGAVAFGAWVQVFGCGWGLAGSALSAAAFGLAWLAWSLPRRVAHRQALRRAEVAHRVATAAVRDAVLRRFAAPFAFERGDIRYTFRPE